MVFATCLDAQGTSCILSTGVPGTTRAEGITEQLADLILICTSTSNATPAGVAIPQVNIQVSLNTNLTSRIVGTRTPGTPDAFASEALLMIDEPFPAAGQVPPSPPAPAPIPSNNATSQLACLASNNTNCAIISKGAGKGAFGNYNGSAGHYNVFQGVQDQVNAVAWIGVPIDPPGTSGVRIIRITNLRGDAFQLGVSSTLIPTQINAVIALTPPQNLTVVQPPGGSAVGQIFAGLNTAVNGSAAFLRCLPHNASLLGGAGTPAFDFNLQAVEGFASAFKFRNYGTVIYGPEFPQQLTAQNVPGFRYDTETGFYSPSLFPSAHNLGLAQFGTRIRAVFKGVTAGTHLFVPATVTLTGEYAFGITPGQLQLVQTQQSGNSLAGYQPVAPTATIGITPVAEVEYSGSTAYATYEVINANSFVLETVTIPVAVAFNNKVKPAASVVTAETTFAPLSSVTTSEPAPFPRFGASSALQTAYAINSCSATPLSGEIISKTGPQNARVWNIEVNSGPHAATGATIDSFALTQTSGAKCSPVVKSPSFPHALGDLHAYTSVIAPVTIDFTGCSAAARFNVDIPLSANGGESTGRVVQNNQLR